jgi:hypothetical protein
MREETVTNCVIHRIQTVYSEVYLTNTGSIYVLRRNIFVIEDINLQTALSAVTCLAEGLASAQCRASNAEWFLIDCVGTHRLTLVRMEEQLILLLKASVRNRASRCCRLE